MSNIEQHSEEQRKVVLNAEDIKNVREFSSHFQIPMPETLKVEVDKFEKLGKNYSFEDQKKLRAYIANWMIASSHALFKDPIFDNIRTMSNEAWYEEQFHMDLEEILSEKKEEK